MKQHNQENHEFAFYSDALPNLASLKKSDIFELSNKDLYQRIIKILRLRIDDIFILFNSSTNIKCRILTISKDKISLIVEHIQPNKKLGPEIYWLLPLLKKEAFEDCLYSLTEMGIQEIQPTITRKSQQIAPYLQSDRTANIIVSAAEQSKQFILPKIHSAQTLEKALKSLDKDPGSRIFLDPTGSSFFEIIKDIKQNNITKIVCAVGPEGDLTEDEKQLLKDYNFQFCKLTETVLRAKQAVAIASGIFRTML